MMTELRQAVARAVQSAVEATTGEHIALPTVEDPPRLEFGDLAVPAALELGRKLGRPPRQLAEELHAHLEAHPTPEVSRWTIAGPGYLNAFLDRGYLLIALFERLQEPLPEPSGAKVIVEHTSINPNKAAHIGHLRNACLGDTLVRVLRHQGVEVEIQNYIDDTGVQVADVVVGLIDVRGLDAEAVEALPDPFDYYCWDLYAEITGAPRNRRAAPRAPSGGAPGPREEHRPRGGPGARCRRAHHAMPPGDHGSAGNRIRPLGARG